MPFSPLRRFLPAHLSPSRSLLVILALYLAAAITYSVANPLFEAPDEVWHFGYVHWLAQGHGLAGPSRAGVELWAQEGSQPPLYYLAAAALTAAIPQNDWQAAVHENPHAAIGNAASAGNRNRFVPGPANAWPWQGVTLAAHVARLFSVLLGAVTVACAYAIARQAAPGFPAAGPLAAALVAFTPQFLFITSSVSNDNMATAVCAAGVYVCVRIATAAKPPAWRWLLALGVLVGLAALSKLSGLLLAGLAVLSLGLAAWRLRSWRLLVQGVGVVAAAGLLVAGWWYWRNWRLYGDPSGLAAMFAVGPARDEAAGASELAALAPGVWRSAWAVFGWFNVVASEWVYWLYTALTLIGVLGWAGGWLVQRERLRAGVRWEAAALLLVWSLAIGAALVRWAQINYPQGRLLFPAIAAWMPLLAVGLLAWWPQRFQRGVTVGLGAGLLALALAAPFVWMLPAYAAPKQPAAGAPVPNPVNIPVGDAIRLVGYEISPAQVQGGDAVDVTLYWQADKPVSADYSVFVHAVDELGIVQGQSDSYPAQGALPTGQWQPGTTVRDPHRLVLPDALPGPGTLRIEAGLYTFADGKRLPVGAGSDTAQDAAQDAAKDKAVLGEVAVAPRESAEGIPNPLAINFEDKIELIGYSTDQRTLHPGDTLRLKLWWKALAPMDKEYVVFTHLVYPPDAVWAQKDQQPQGGAARTTTWQVGQVVPDEYKLKLPDEAPPGVYTVEVGLYEKESKDRLKVNFDPAGVKLAKVRVK